jgi:hypothetical protein
LGEGEEGHPQHDNSSVSLIASPQTKTYGLAPNISLPEMLDMYHDLEPLDIFVLNGLAFGQGPKNLEFFPCSNPTFVQKLH